MMFDLGKSAPKQTCSALNLAFWCSKAAPKLPFYCSKAAPKQHFSCSLSCSKRLKPNSTPDFSEDSSTTCPTSYFYLNCLRLGRELGKEVTWV